MSEEKVKSDPQFWEYAKDLITNGKLRHLRPTMKLLEDDLSWLKQNKPKSPRIGILEDNIEKLTQTAEFIVNFMHQIEKEAQELQEELVRAYETQYKYAKMLDALDVPAVEVKLFYNESVKFIYDNRYKFTNMDLKSLKMVNKAIHHYLMTKGEWPVTIEQLKG